METSTNRANKKRNTLEDLKQCNFYNTFVQRKDIITLSDIQEKSKQKEYFIQIIKRFENNHRNGIGFDFQVYSLISFQYHQTQTISKATEESQELCKHNIFSEYLLTIYNQLQMYTFEQISTLLSISFYIFIESLERKITQIDSYEIFKYLLRPQILLTNTYNTPLFTQQQIIDFNQFMTEYFYRYYSLYELRMTTYQEVNIYGRLKGETPIVVEQDKDKDSIQEEEEDEFDFKDVDIEQTEEVEQEAPKIDEKDEQYIEEHLKLFKLNYNNKLEQSQILNEAEKILTKKK